MSNSGVAMCGQHTTQHTILIKMNLRNPAAAYNFTSLATLAGAVDNSSSTTSQWTPGASNSLVTVLTDFAHAGMSAEEVATPPHLIYLTFDTHAIEDRHMGDSTRNNYTRSLVKSVFWTFNCHPELIFHRSLLQHVHKMKMACPH